MNFTNIPLKNPDDIPIDIPSISWYIPILPHQLPLASESSMALNVALKQRFAEKSKGKTIGGNQ